METYKPKEANMTKQEVMEIMVKWIKENFDAEDVLTGNETYREIGEMYTSLRQCFPNVPKPEQARI